ITPWRHAIVTQRAREEGLQRLIERADELVDQELDDVMRDVRCGAEEPIVKALLGQEIAQEISTSAESPWSEAMKDLVRRLGTNKVIAAPVRTAKKVFGLLVVDRQWQERTLNDADQEALVTFARLAAANVTISESERQHTEFLQAMREILTHMQTEFSLEQNL